MDRLTIPASLQQMQRVADFAEISLLKGGCGQDTLRKMLVTVDEVFSNYFLCPQAYKSASLGTPK